LVGKGRITAAINELTMAQQASDGDFYLRAAVTTRLKELMNLRAEMSD
jgi:predicted Zn-dependent protease